MLSLMLSFTHPLPRVSLSLSLSLSRTLSLSHHLSLQKGFLFISIDPSPSLYLTQSIHTSHCFDTWNVGAISFALKYPLFVFLSLSLSLSTLSTLSTLSSSLLSLSPLYTTFTSKSRASFDPSSLVPAPAYVLHLERSPRLYLSPFFKILF